MCLKERQAHQKITNKMLWLLVAIDSFTKKNRKIHSIKHWDAFVFWVLCVLGKQW